MQSAWDFVCCVFVLSSQSAIDVVRPYTSLHNVFRAYFFRQQQQLVTYAYKLTEGA